jgi:hypothetical protein
MEKEDIHPEQQHGETDEQDGGKQGFHKPYSGNSEEMGW